MVLMSVTYRGEKTDRFDRNYYRTRHLPLVKEVWGPLGLETISAFFPEANEAAAGPETGIVAACLCGFRDEASFQRALASPNTPRIMDDLPHFTDLKAQQNVLCAVRAEKEPT